MKALSLLLLLASFACTFALLSHSKEIIQSVNTNPHSTWIAGVNQRFALATDPEIRRLLGWKAQQQYLPIQEVSIPIDLPTNFDSTIQWPNCTTIGSIQNQASCGSCWAFGAVGGISDRFCIHSNGRVNEFLSFQQMVSCGPGSCEGGDAGGAWDYAKDRGLVTANAYNYTEPTCPPQDQPCTDFKPTEPCRIPQSQRYFLNHTYAVGGRHGADAIAAEILANGPVEMCFDVYEDFIHYKSGVYSHQAGRFLGGHCVKCIGWGVENGTPYWLCNNSWTTYWGDKGQFKIRRGNDECGIESEAVAGLPKIV